MDKLKLGLDIANLDLLPKEAETADMGYKRPVFDYSCEEGKKMRMIYVRKKLLSNTNYLT